MRGWDGGEGGLEVGYVVGAQLAEIVLPHRVHLSLRVKGKHPTAPRLHPHKPPDVPIEHHRGRVTSSEAQQSPEEGHFLHEGDDFGCESVQVEDADAGEGVHVVAALDELARLEEVVGVEVAAGELGDGGAVHGGEGGEGGGGLPVGGELAWVGERYLRC